MRRLFPVLFLFVCLHTFGQNTSLNTFISWFSKADKAAVQNYFDSRSYHLLEEKDSLDFHVLHYSLVKTEQGLQLHSYLLLNDSLPEFISFESCDHSEQQAIFNQLKASRFKLLNTDINGNFITSTYDNGIFLVHEDYQAIPNPIGKGEIAYYRYRIIQKNGRLDTMNGEKTVLNSENGSSYISIRENYTNGVLDGERTFYFPNGTVKRKENYRAGRLNGLASDFNKEGKLVHSATHSYHWKYGMEKWYNSEGKVVKTMQWQRDLPVGIQKQTFNGTLIESIPYVKGVKQGLAKVPVYFEELVDSANTEPLGIETVNYQNNLKTGKAICTRFGSNDTLYTAFYKAGKLDSTYTWYQQSMHSYYKNIPRYTKKYVNGLEHGTAIYIITAGPLKDSIYQTESYNNGKLDGLVVQYYKKSEDRSPEFAPGEWYSNYSFATYAMGVQNGPFIFRQDSMNYSKGTYLNGQLEGLNETGTVLGGKWIKTSGHYQNGLKTGEWTSQYLTDSIVITEHFDRNQKHGSVTKSIKGFKTEERFYIHDTLQRLRFYERNADYRFYTIDFKKSHDSALVLVETYKEDTFGLLSYTFKISENLNQDTILSRLVSSIENDSEATQSMNGSFVLNTPEYQKNGNYRNGKQDGIIQIKHSDVEIVERITYENGSITNYSYCKFNSSEPYSGVFISATSGEQISVKDGLRHGWCVEYDASKNELRKTKYSKGIPKKLK